MLFLKLNDYKPLYRNTEDDHKGNYIDKINGIVFLIVIVTIS